MSSYQPQSAMYIIDQVEQHPGQNVLPLPLSEILVYIHRPHLRDQILTIGYIDERNEYSVISLGVVRQSGQQVLSLPRVQQNHEVWVEGVGLINPRDYTIVTCDIPGLGAREESMSVQVAEWDNPLVHIVIGRRFLDRLRSQAAQATAPQVSNHIGHTSPQATGAAPLTAAQQQTPHILVNGIAAADSPGSMRAQHGNNSPPMPNGLFPSPISPRPQLPRRPSQTSPHSHLGSLTNSAPTSSQSNIFSRNTGAPSSTSSFPLQEDPLHNNIRPQESLNAVCGEDFSQCLSVPPDEIDFDDGTKVDAEWDCY